MATNLKISGNEVLETASVVLNAGDTLEISFEGITILIKFDNNLELPTNADYSVSDMVMTFQLTGFNNPLGSTMSHTIGSSEGRNINIRLSAYAIVAGGKVGARTVVYSIFYGELGSL